MFSFVIDRELQNLFNIQSDRDHRNCYVESDREIIDDNCRDRETEMARLNPHTLHECTMYIRVAQF